MNKCIDTEIQEMLPDLLHGSLDGHERQRVAAHLATCESCREDLDVIRTVKGAAVFAPAIDVDRVVRLHCGWVKLVSVDREHIPAIPLLLGNNITPIVRVVRPRFGAGAP